jgi:NAD(P)H-hydrate epimerase
MANITYLNQNEAIAIDQELFSSVGFSVDQLMELAGLSVASVVAKQYPVDRNRNRDILICCGPGNNGGDGLIASRHLKLFGYNPTILYPKKGRSDLFERLVKQCNDYEIPFIDSIPDPVESRFGLIMDALFGFSFKPPLRPEFKGLLSAMSSKGGVPVISVDIPSGWDVNEGPPKDEATPVLEPDCLISLTAPKHCAKHFKGKSHWLGGRFVPESLAKRFNLSFPPYPGTEQCVLISNN